MPDDIDPNAPPPAAPAPQPSPTPAAPPAPAFTQAQVDAMVADAAMKAHNAAEAAARRRYEGKEPAPAKPAPAAGSPPAAPPAGPGLTAQDIFRVTALQAATTEYGLTARASEMFLERVMVEKPADVRAWVAAEVAALGLSKSTPSTPPPAGSPAAPAAATQPPAPATSTPSGSPPASSVGVYDLKPSQMKPADVAAYVAKNGHRAFSALVRQELSGTRVTAPPRR